MSWSWLILVQIKLEYRVERQKEQRLENPTKPRYQRRFNRAAENIDAAQALSANPLRSFGGGLAEGRCLWRKYLWKLVSKTDEGSNFVRSGAFSTIFGDGARVVTFGEPLSGFIADQAVVMIDWGRKA